MVTKCKNCPLARRNLFHDLSDDDVQAMQKFKVGELTINPGTPVLMEGSNSPQLFTALRGMAVRYKTLESGRRQVTNFVFPGDFIGLQAGVMREMQHSVEASTHMTLCVFDRSGLWSFFKSHPERGFDMTWLAAVEEHLLGERLATVGQRTALEAVSWALMRMYQRLDALEQSSDNKVALPFKQQDLADSLGLSLVHTNKTLGKLRDMQLATWSNGELRINDLGRLAQAAGEELAPPAKRPLM